jgi:hypothetical protein
MTEGKGSSPELSVVRRRSAQEIYCRDVRQPEVKEGSLICSIPELLERWTKKRRGETVVRGESDVVLVVVVESEERWSHRVTMRGLIYSRSNRMTSLTPPQATNNLWRSPFPSCCPNYASNTSFRLRYHPRLRL